MYGGYKNLINWICVGSCYMYIICYVFVLYYSNIYKKKIGLKFKNKNIYVCIFVLKVKFFFKIWY